MPRDVLDNFPKSDSTLPQGKSWRPAPEWRKSLFSAAVSVSLKVWQGSWSAFMLTSEYGRKTCTKDIIWKMAMRDPDCTTIPNCQPLRCYTGQRGKLIKGQILSGLCKVSIAFHNSIWCLPQCPYSQPWNHLSHSYHDWFTAMPRYMIISSYIYIYVICTYIYIHMYMYMHMNTT